MNSLTKDNNRNPRYLAVKTLERISDGAYSNLQINNVIDSTKMSEKDTRLFTNIVYGVIQHRLTFEYYVNNLVKHPGKLKNWVKELLYTAIYQMQYLDKVPNRAIFDESIEIAKFRGHDGIRRLVTGVLHKIDREGLPKIKGKNALDTQSIKYSVPTWIIKQLNNQVGKEKTVSILESINQPANQSIRINIKKIQRDELVKELERIGFEVRDSEVAADALVVKKGVAAHTALFKEGFYTIQDESAMLPVQSMAIGDDDYVLDACAAPGGKTTQIAEHLTTGLVVALDLHENKLHKIMENAERMGLEENIEVHACDARKVDDIYEDDVFDKILVDAPCSGLGLIRRKPEIRYEKSIEDVEQLATIQGEILDAVAPKLKVGGQLVYSTCTILNQENSKTVKAFLDKHPEFEEIKVQTALGIKADRREDYLKIFPDDFGSDGFFIAGFKKIK
ncbi:16S rRNA (cytosine(967)-C(5))-methyltransferase RsmB [Fructilactobacillus sp. Tb1]|uniref:16S rRNA (cytosine(967)-C(5))-methyltransferase RsmB n=1 Tax=Fructilactobacillus sp. Tb1 TaxID=3422304 RepID=UPI003D2CCA07